MKIDKKTILILFIFVAIAQLAVPISMIYKKESVAKSGEIYKFKTRPIDPYDPFRGKYITLNFERKSIEVEDREEWEDGEMAFFTLKKDSLGYAEVFDISKSKPKNGDFIKMKVAIYHRGTMGKTISYKLPFDRFYMNEDEALNAEIEYEKANRNSNKENAYAVVKILDGEHVLEDVIIGGVSAKDLK
jgi:uncharacterized membrane-anchored protein|tara:strand:+ start:1015 stop:1578 length:564 start_codon:yes stop_codon:yes gene_type:complete